MMLVFALLVVYQAKHFLCDYPLQRPWMLGKFKGGWAWVGPLAAHAGVHGAATWLIGFFLMSTGWRFALELALLDFAAHFAMDRIKASPNLMGRWKPLSAEQYEHARFEAVGPYDAFCSPLTIATFKQQARAVLHSNRMFWNSLGIDQMVHHLTHYLIIWLLVH